jgi:hypothetical protein
MFAAALVTAGLLTFNSTVAQTPEATPVPTPPARRVGEELNYSLGAVLNQSIAGRDVFGKKIDQTIAPTTIRGHESITVTKITSAGVTVHRRGSITAVVDNTKPVTSPGQGWSLVARSGLVVRDRGKLGGLFLLPLPFLGESAVKAGDDLAVGDAWTAKLGTRLFAMTAQPKMHFVVIGTRSVLGVHVFTIKATGQVPMREPVMTSSGEPLGYAVGTAHITAQFDYDRDNRRLISLQATIEDSLHYTGATKRAVGKVRDRQTWSLALDPSSMTGEAARTASPNPKPSNGGLQP